MTCIEKPWASFNGFQLRDNKRLHELEWTCYNVLSSCAFVPLCFIDMAETLGLRGVRYTVI